MRTKVIGGYIRGFWDFGVTDVWLREAVRLFPFSSCGSRRNDGSQNLNVL